MKFLIAAVLLVCTVSAQIPAGWNYNPFLYYPYSALQPPVQETAEVAQARAAHMAAHAAALARTRRSPQYLAAPVYVPQDTPEVQAAKMEHYRAVYAASAANGSPVDLMAKTYVPQDAPEVYWAKQAFINTYNAEVARNLAAQQ